MMPTTSDIDVLLRKTIDNLPDGVLLVGPKREIIYTNRMFSTMWGIKEEAFLVESREDLLKYVCGKLCDPDGFLLSIVRSYQSSAYFHDELLLKDGRIFSRRCVPFSEDPADSTRIWILTDVTDAKHAEVDNLTGLPNRRAYSRRFPGIAALDDGCYSGVAIMDVDNFKAYNDLYGHAAGDAVLAELGRLLLSRLRRDDVAFRIGGEEFLIASRDRTDAGLIDFFETLRGEIEARNIAHAGNPPRRVVTASFGLSVFAGPRNPRSLFDTIDRALYASKATGRNRVTLVASE
jgi:diguanylate cyclase (GGDEF)-like protein